MPDIYDLADQFRDRLLRRERAVASEMVRRYAAVYRRINDEVATILDEFDAGEEPSVARLLQLKRLQELQVQIRHEVGRFSAWAGEQIQVGQLWAVDQAAADAERLMRAALGKLPHGVVVSFNRLNRAATARIIAAIQDESPLARLLDSLGARAAEAIKQELVNAVSLGWGARRIAKAVRQASGETLTRAMRIARTETLRAYREGTRETYKANSDVVGQWEWRSARQVRTCAACWAMDGRRFPLDVPMSEHPNGRCMQLPVIDREALGLPPGTSRRSSETGAQAFAKLSEADKRQVLGAKYTAYARGEITLADVVGLRHSDDWGDAIFEKSARAMGVTTASIPEPTPVLLVTKQPVALDPVPSSGPPPVSAAINIQGRNEPSRRALDLIDRIHGDGVLPEIELKKAQLPHGVRGSYRRVAPHEIKISLPQNGVPYDPVNTTLHEIGHFLDQHGIGDGTNYASDMVALGRVNALVGWWMSVQESEAYRGKQSIMQVALAQSLPRDLIEFMRYELSPRELWARSYNQYIATRAGERDLLANLELGHAEITGVAQWANDDFEPIAGEIDELFRSLNWRD